MGKPNDPDTLMEGIREGDRTALARGITLLESTKPEGEENAHRLLDLCLPYSGDSIRVGITGVPGVGKSTFIDAMGKFWTEKGHKVAVLAIDPSSSKSGGSILGDKTRMTELASDPDAFVRPSPAEGSLGGVARKTRESIFLCEAAGYDRIIVETIGVGQSETVVDSMVDVFLLLMLAGAGDELQGIKRGIMEMADIVAINKADGDNADKAKEAKKDYEHALSLLPPSKSGWKPVVKTCSALERSGIGAIDEATEAFIDNARKQGTFTRNREEQARYWLHQTIETTLKKQFYEEEAVQGLLSEVEDGVSKGKISSTTAAEKLLRTFRLDAREKGDPDR